MRNPARRAARGRLRGTAAASLAACLAAGAIAPAHARITSLVIRTRTSPALNGAAFGQGGRVGQYEQLDGTAYGTVDPADPANALIQDIALAPRNADGTVSYSMDVSILKPIDPARGNHVLLYDVVNRGNKVVTGSLNTGVTAASPAGDGFLENQGYSMVWSGWQGDLVPQPGQLGISVPVASNRDGSPITGLVRSEFVTLAVPATPVTTQNVTAGFSSNTPGYPAADLDPRRALLTSRVHQADAQSVVAPSDFAFADCTTTPFPGTPDPRKLCLRGGFDTDRIYELYYVARNPLVLGLGFAATRDLVSFLRSSTDADNPLAGATTASVLHGTSQSGRWAREYLQLGFNADESGRRVFDGMNPHIASGRGAFNVRFGQPGRLSGTEHTEKQYPGLDSALTYEDSFDPYTGLSAGLLDRCRRDGTCPKISHVMSDTEYWQANGSMDTTDALGRTDLPDPANVRVYQMSSAQHGGFSPTAPVPTATGICQHVADANSYTYTLRDLLVRLTQWVTTGRAPPASRHATIAAGTLVEPAQVAFPAIPGVTYDLARTYNTRELYFRGFGFNARDESGSVAEPPLPIHTYNVRLPQVDADGNDVGGVRSPTLQAPLATYTSWNSRAAGYSEGDSCDLTGSTIPFAATKAERLASGDPRLSLAERYATHDGYVAAVARGANALVRDGFLLPDDAATVVQQAQDSTVLR